MSKMIVTGGAGFIGSNLVDLLVSKGHDVTVIDDLSTGKLENLARLGDRVELIEKDISRISGEDLAGVDTIFHLAALIDVVTSMDDPVSDAKVNYLGTINVLEQARIAGVDQIILTSSAAVYGDTSEIPTTEDAVKFPLSPYGNNKLSSENMLRMYNEIYGMKNTIFRLFNVYGPRQDPSNPYSGVISKFMKRASKDLELLIYGDGEQTRDFVYVEDVCRSLYQAHCVKVPGTFNVGTGKETSVNALARVVIDVIGSKSTIGYRERRPGEIIRSVADSSRLKDRLSISPDIGIKDGIERYWSSIS